MRLERSEEVVSNRAEKIENSADLGLGFCMRVGSRKMGDLWPWFGLKEPILWEG